MAGYIGSKIAVIQSGVGASVAELNYNDTGAAVGVVVASKTVTADANKDVASFRNITLTGELDAGSLDVSGNADIDGTLETDALSIAGVTVTSTAAEINLIDGGTARGTTALADGDGMLVNDAGTMRMSTVQTVKTYMTAGVGGGGTEFIASSGVVSGVASISFTQFDATAYDHYKFYFQHVIPATDDVSMLAHVSTDTGDNYDTTNGNYHILGTTDITGFEVTDSGGYTVGSASNEFGISGQFNLFAPHNTSAYTYAHSDVVYMYSGGTNHVYSSQQAAYGGTIHLVAADVDAIKFIFSSGNVESGEITMFGVVNS
tara:strand:- start:560 stop:1510 length:951 start_codon:yes stop_codon:yes gene_type:complete